MNAFYLNTMIPVDTKSILETGCITDNRIEKIEQLVANYYNTAPVELSVFYKDTDAKILCCFLLHNILRYSMGSIAIKYKIDRLYLRKHITQLHIKCLTDADFMALVNDFKSKL